MNCIYCGKKLTANAKFCIYCGNKVEQTPVKAAVCPVCKSPVEPEDRFCVVCGNKLGFAGDGRERSKSNTPPQPVNIYPDPVTPASPVHANPAPQKSVDKKSVQLRFVMTNLDRPHIQFAVPMKEEIRIGRQRGDIIISDDPEVSRSHCRIMQRNGLLYLVDENSKNGTCCRGRWITPGEEVPIQSGDIIQIGRYNYKAEVRERKI